MRCTSLSMAHYQCFSTEDAEFLQVYLQRAASYLRKLRFNGNLGAMLTVLERLDLIGCKLTELNLGSFVAESATALHSLLKKVLLNCSAVLQDFRGTITTDWQAAFAEDLHLPALVKLSLSVTSASDFCCICKVAMREITLNGEVTCSDVGLSSIGQYCHSLEVFVVEDTAGIENVDQGIIALAQGCTGLETVRLYECYNLSDVGLIAIATHCIHLQELLIEGKGLITDASLINTVKPCWRQPETAVHTKLL